MNSWIIVYNDIIISDSITCKYSACSLGYYSDPFLDDLFRKNILRLNIISYNIIIINIIKIKILNRPSDPSNRRKAPIINRGYYARVKSIDTIINNFLHITNDNGKDLDTTLLPQPDAKSDSNSINPPLSPSNNMKNKRQIINLGCGFDTLSIRW